MGLVSYGCRWQYIWDLRRFLSYTEAGLSMVSGDIFRLHNVILP